MVERRVVGMASLLNIIFPLCMLAWFVGILVLGLRASAKGNAYLRRLPPVTGVPLNMYMYAEKDWLRGWRGPMWRAYRQQQTDPELELLRQEARRGTRYVVLWMFGFPVVVVGVMAVVMVTSHAR